MLLWFSRNARSAHALLVVLSGTVLCRARKPGLLRRLDGSLYDCQVAYDAWEISWSEDKKTWCCAHGGRGCKNAVAPATLVFKGPADFNTTSTELGSLGVLELPHVVRGQPGQEGKLFNRSGKLRDGVNLQFEVWCENRQNCLKKVQFRFESGTQNLVIPVPEPPTFWKAGEWQSVTVAMFDEHTRSHDNGTVWKNKTQLEVFSTQQNRATKIRLRNLFMGTAIPKPGPLAFDCKAALSNWQAAWSERKKVWCCRVDNVACQAPAKLLTGPVDVNRTSDKVGSVGDFAITDTTNVTHLVNSDGELLDGSRLQLEVWCQENANCLKGLSFGSMASVGHSAQGLVIPVPEPSSEWQSGSWHNVDIPIVSDHHHLNIPWGNMSRVELFAVRLSAPTVLKIKNVQIIAPFATVPTYDCEGEFDNWEKAWSKDRKKWCCKSTGQGCGKAPPPVAANPAVAKPTVAPVTKAPASVQKAPAPTTTRPRPPAAPTTKFNYNIQILPQKTTQPPPKHNCWAGYASWETSWPDEKKSWCCANEAKGCSGGSNGLYSGASSTGAAQSSSYGSSKIIWIIMFLSIGVSAAYHFGVLSLSGLQSCLDNFRGPRRYAHGDAYRAPTIEFRNTGGYQAPSSYRQM